VQLAYVDESGNTGGVDAGHSEANRSAALASRRPWLSESSEDDRNDFLLRSGPPGGPFDS